MNYSVYHDESVCEKSNFLYHGYLYIHNDYREEIIAKLSSIRDEKWKDKRVHFKEFKSDSTKSKLGQAWIDYTFECLKEGKMLFYLFGIDKNNVNNFWDNSKSFDANVYERFFEIGLNSSIGWFSRGNKAPKAFQVSNIFFEIGDYNEGRESKVLQSFFKNYHNPLANIQKTATPLHGCHLESKDMNSIGLQLTDLLLGSCRIAYEKNSKRANIECAEKMKKVILKFSSEDTNVVYNVNSSLYKKFAVSFFPSENKLSKEDFLNKRLTPDRGFFYSHRKTYWCREREERGFEELSLF